VLDVAKAPQHKSGPSRKNIVIIGFFLSLMVAALMVFLSARWRNFDGRDERKLFIVEIVGYIQKIFAPVLSLPVLRSLHARIMAKRSEST